VSQVALDQNRSLETSIFEQRLQPEGDHDLLPLVLLQALFIEKQFHS
jgi:hypothetical protein